MRTNFGEWTYDRHLLTLTFRDVYEIDLERIRDSASMLDWIFQVQAKRWATPAVMNDLLAAFQAIFDPQRNLCSWGQDRRLPAHFLEAA